MARIPIYQERQQASQAFAAPEMRAPDVGAGAIGRGLQQVGQGLQNLAVGQLRLDTENGKARASDTFGKVQNEFISLLENEKLEAKPGAENFVPNFTSKLQKRRDEILEAETDPFARNFLKQSLNQLGQTLSREALSFEATEMRGNRINSVKSGIDGSSSSILQNPNPQLVKQTYGQQKALIDSMALLPREKRELDDYLRVQLAQAYVGSLAVKNPRALVGMSGVAIEGTKLSPSNVRETTINFILESEGSDYVPDDAGAGEAKYGIVAKYNPGVDVKNLTKEQAAQIYREKYWSAVDADNLPPALAAVMTDTAVNMGAGKAKELLEKSGGDIGSFLELRRDHYKNLATSDPKKYGQYLNGWLARTDRLQALVQSSDMTDVATVDLTKGLPENNPASENILQWLPVSQQLSYLRQAQTVIKQDQALVQKQFVERINNSNAMAVDGIQDPKPLTSADFFKAFEPQEATKQFESYQTNQKLAETMSTFKTQSASEIATELATWQPQPGEDYAISEKRFNVLQQAAVNIAKQRKDDPAAYSMKSSPVVQESYTQMEDIMRTPNASTLEINRATNDYVTKSLAEQERLGIVNPKILTAPMMEDLSRRMNAGNESAGDIAVSLRQMYGKKHFAQILSEMNEKNKLPSAMLVIPDLMDNPAALELASRLSKVKASELEVGIDGTTVKTVKESVTQYILPLRISAGNAEGRTVAQINAYEDMMLKMAYQQIGSGATTSGTQAAKNANELLLGKYQFVGTLRMPKGLDATQVTRGLDRVVREQVLTVDPKTSTLDVPVDFTNARTKEEALAEWQSTVRSRYMWISDNDTKAANLWAQGQNGIFYAVKKEGKQISVPFDDAIRANLRTIEDVRKRVDPMQLQRERLAEETRRLQLQMEQE